MGAISICIVAIAFLYSRRGFLIEFWNLASVFYLLPSVSISLTYRLLYPFMKSFFFIILAPFGFIILASIALCRLRFSSSKIFPKIERISVLKGFKNKFGFSAIRNGLNIIVKVIMIISPVCIAWIYIFEILCIQCAGGVNDRLWGALLLLSVFLVLYLIVGFSDYCVRFFSWQKELRMTREELVREQKDQEGDSEFKGHRKRLAIELLSGGSVSAVDSSDVLIVNPSHYAVAISWKRDSNRPPIVAAKGVDEIACVMRERASINNIPQYRDPVASRAIYSTVKVGNTIGRTQYRAVASAIKFATKMKGLQDD